MHPPLLSFLLDRISSFTAIIAIGAALIRYKNLDKPLKVVFAFIAFSFLLIIVNVACAYYGIPNLVVFHFYAIFEFAFVLWFFSYFVNGILKQAILPLVGLFAVWSTVNFFFVQTGLQLNTYTRPVEAILIVLYCIAYFNNQTQLDATERWGAVSHNWITLAFLIFYTCSFFIFIFSNYFLTRNDPLTHYFWKGYTAILVAENVLLAVGFYQAKRHASLNKL